MPVPSANFVNPGTSTPPLNSGDDSATFVVLTKQPFAKNFVNVTSNSPQTDPLTAVYAAEGTVISPVPVPEPTTILAWAGMAGAVALVRRVRKSRTTDRLTPTASRRSDRRCLRDDGNRASDRPAHPER